MISDDEVQQLQFTDHLYSAHSPYQQIDIYHSKEFGEVLFLDRNTSKFLITVVTMDTN